MSHLPRLAARFYNRAHFVLPAYAETIAHVLANRFDIAPSAYRVTIKADGGQEVEPCEVEPQNRPARSPMLTKSGIMVLPIVGGLYHRGDSFDAMSGAQSYTNVQNMLLASMANEDVRGILLDIDSPGGEVSGCLELGDTIMTARDRKPIWAVANACAASAAYALASSASKLYVTPSGQVGSIGCVWMHTDLSKALDKAGVSVSYVYAGKHKIDGNPTEPLPKDVRASIQSEIDHAYTMFVDMVAARRPMTARQIRGTEAAMFRATEAVDIGLADQVGSFDAALGDFEQEVGLTRRTHKTSSGGKKMSKTTDDAPGLDQALARAREDGVQAATASMQGKVTDAYIQGRADAMRIMQHEAAAGRTKAAIVMAGNSKFNVEEATAMLAVMAKDADESGAGFQASLKKADPKVDADAATPANPPTQSEDFQKGVQAHLHRMIQGKKA